MPTRRMLDELARGPIDRGRAVGSDEQAALVEQLSAIREELLEVAEGWSPWVQGREADRDASGRNLLQYLALRGRDLRGIDPVLSIPRRCTEVIARSARPNWRWMTSSGTPSRDISTASAWRSWC